MTDPVRCIPGPPRASSRSKYLALGWIQHPPVPFPQLFAGSCCRGEQAPSICHEKPHLHPGPLKYLLVRWVNFFPTRAKGLFLYGEVGEHEISPTPLPHRLPAAARQLSLSCPSEDYALS